MPSRFLFYLFTILLFSCSQDENPIPLGRIDLDIEINEVQAHSIHGIYQAGIDLNESNYLILDLKVNEPGTYSLSTEERNGFKFTGSGKLQAGDTTIILQGFGMPIDSGTTVFEVTTNHPDEKSTYPIYVFPNLHNKIIFSTVRFSDGGDPYTIAQSGIGQMLWQLDGYTLSAAVDNDIIYLANSDGLKAVRINDGSAVWSKPEFANTSSLNFYNGNLYTVTTDGVYHKVNASNGELKWSYHPQANDQVSGAPLVNGAFVFVEDSGNLHALDQNSGISIWNIPFEKLSGTAVLTNDTLIVGSRGGLLAISAENGNQIWENEVRCTSDLVLIGSKVYFYNHDVVTSCNTTTGETDTSFYIDWGLAFSPARFDNSVIFYEGGFGTLFSFKTYEWSRIPIHSLTCPIIVDDQIIFFGSDYGLDYYSPLTGDLLLSFAYQTDVDRIRYSEILAIKDQSTGIVSYPTESGMD